MHMKKRYLYFSFLVFSCSFAAAQSGIISTIAGQNIGNNVTAIDFAVNPYGMVPDNMGNVYIANSSNHLVSKLNILSGKLTVVAGNGSYGYSGDGGQATDAQLNYPVAVAIDKNNNLYVVDESDQCVREINYVTGIITTVAGNGNWGFYGDNGPATSANLNNPLAIAIDTANNLYISDYSNNRIREVYATNGFINTIAGNDSTGYNGDSIPADSARLHSPAGIALDKAGNIYFVDQNNCRIRMIKASNDTIYTISGGKAGFSGDGGPATKAQFWYPLGIAVDASGNVYIADTYENRVRKITVSNDTINTISGNGSSSFSGDGGPASSATLFQPHFLSFDASGNLFIADMGNNRIREILASNGTITTLSGDGMVGYNGNNIPAITSQLSNPTSVSVDDSGNVYFADNGNNMIREINKAGNILKIAGNGTGGYSGDGGPAGKAQLSGPDGITVNDSGYVFIADEYNNRIRKVNPVTNTITTIAGKGNAGYSGDGGYATNAELFYPVDIAIDSKGNIFIADMINDRIREINAVSHGIKTVAGNGYNSTKWSGGFSGDGGLATLAELNQPQGVAVDNNNNLYIADTWNYRIRKVNLTTGKISTIAGNGNWGYSGDGGPATVAELSPPTSVKVDAFGSIYIADFYNNVVRQVNVWDSAISTIAGTSIQSYSGDGGPAVSADLDLAHGLGFDTWGNLYIADYGNNRIRMVTTPAGISTLKQKGSISVYPNPAENEIHINISGFESDHATLQVIDITGKVVMQKEISKLYSAAPVSLNISGLSQGMYFVNLKSAVQQITAKIIKD
jgi:sugar lactone lactonase YvrE